MRPSTQSGSVSTARPAGDEDGAESGRMASLWCFTYRPASRYGAGWTWGSDKLQGRLGQRTSLTVAQCTTREQVQVGLLLLLLLLFHVWVDASQIVEGDEGGLGVSGETHCEAKNGR